MSETKLVIPTVEEQTYLLATDASGADVYCGRWETDRDGRLYTTLHPYPNPLRHWPQLTLVTCTSKCDADGIITMVRNEPRPSPGRW